MPNLKDELFEREMELAKGDGATYRAHLTEQALIVIPGQLMEKQETVEAMDASPGWDEVSFSEQRLHQLGEDTALLSYRFEGLRGSDRYAALMGSLYVADAEGWKLAYHQQTPLT